MDIAGYEDKEVTITVEYTGKLEKRPMATYTILTHKITDQDGITRIINPDRVTGIQALPEDPEWWPPLPGDTLRYGSDSTDFVYIVSQDGKQLISNRAPGTAVHQVSAISAHGNWARNSLRWELVSKGRARLLKEGK